MKGDTMNNKLDKEIQDLTPLNQDWTLEWISKIPFGDDNISIFLKCNLTINNPYLFEADLANLESIGGTVNCTKPSKEGKAAQISFVIHNSDQNEQVAILAKLFYLLATHPKGHIESA